MFYVSLFNTNNSIKHHSFAYSKMISSISNNSVKHKSFVCSQFKCQSTQSKWSNSSIWPLGRTLSGATTPGQSEPGSDG